MDIKPIIIGLIGGSGPWAGIDIEIEIFRECQIQLKANKDQEYLNVINYQYTLVNDRNSANIEGSNTPLIQYRKCIAELIKLNVDVLAIACNSAHIYFVELSKCSTVPMLNIINETVNHVIKTNPNIKKIGLLATPATIQNELYQKEFIKHNVVVVTPKLDIQKQIMQLIYHIKAIGPINTQNYSSVTTAFEQIFNQSLKWLIDNNCQLIVLGCTELPLLIPKLSQSMRKVIVNPNRILAASLVNYAQRLKQHMGTPLCISR